MSHLLLMSFNDNSIMNLNNTLNRFLEYTFSLHPKQKIRFSYIGTASGDRLIERVFFTAFTQAKFGKHVRVSILQLTKTRLTTHQIKKHLLSQDIVFIGGGNTEKMLEIWQASGFTSVLNKLKTAKKLPILAGVSAGGMYPFHSGLTDATPGQYRPLSCLYWFKESFCPHANSTVKARCVYENDQQLERLEAYKAAINGKKLPAGFAVPDDCMLHFYNFKFIRALSARENTHCSYVSRHKIMPIHTLHLTAINSRFMSLERNTKLKKRDCKLHCWYKSFKVINFFKRLLSYFKFNSARRDV
ncbi:MAG: Type 1 glutamine amidotransferase-like domain-containing protein [Gammaproteobacteria bacterium]